MNDVIRRKALRRGPVLSLVLLCGAALAQEPRQTPTVHLGFARSRTLADKVECVELHGLQVQRLVLERPGAEPVVDEVDLHIWTGTRADAIEEIDPVTGLLRRQHGVTEGYLQMGQVLEDGTEQRGPQMNLTSPLEDVGVSFVPAAGAPGGHARHYDTAEALSERLLVRMEAPRDWSRLLPANARGEGGATLELGATWDVDPRDMELLLSPFGDLFLRGGDDADPRILRAFNTGMGGNLHIGFDGDVAGSARARLVGDGVDPDLGPVATIEISFALDMSKDQGDLARQRRLTDDPEEELEIRGAGLALHLEGTSRVSWSKSAPSPARFVTEGAQTVRASVELEEGDGTVVRQSIELEGTLGVTARFTPVARVGSARKR